MVTNIAALEVGMAPKANIQFEAISVNNKVSEQQSDNIETNQSVGLDISSYLFSAKSLKITGVEPFQLSTGPYFLNVTVFFLQ